MNSENVVVTIWLWLAQVMLNCELWKSKEKNLSRS
jgi:hypothetical protein